MTKTQRVKNILLGLLMILVGLLFMLSPTSFYPAITGLLCLGLIIRGIRLLFFYFSMARHMVNGRSMLYQAVILIDLGLFAGSLTQVPLIYVMIYLAIIHLFTGVIDILRALEAKKYGSSWKLNLSHGIVNVLIAFTCIIFIKITWLAVTIYSIGLIYSGAMRIGTALRKNRMVYIQ